MKNQNISDTESALGRPVALPVQEPPPRPGITIGPKLRERAEAAAGKSSGGPITLVPTELVGVHLVQVPKSRARQRPALVRFAVEERIGVSIDGVSVVEGPRDNKDGQALALVCDPRVLDAPSAGRLMPDFLLIPRPTDADWSVWQEGDRAIIRTAQGTGFAVSAAALPLMWRRAGQPSVISLLDPVPEEMHARDAAPTPPPPDATDLSFSFGQQRRDQARFRRMGLTVIAICMLAGLGHMTFLALDTWALRNLAVEARQRAQAAVSERLPGTTVTADTGPILARLSPGPESVPRGDFLPLLASITGALAETGTPLGFRRLAWSAQQNELVLLVQSNGLSDLQTIQQGLESQGFTVRSGAASASDGGAEAELRIRGGGS
ncbi:hypothetical protein BOO69_00230 [Sulfitobacter alexandrii]|uniref:GspL cytoplasmic actin-ATPase-like domain-containing protein n=1 Tax=Sulfitobacter alexandrii TaxID=1917485 RepID=A0A1J0WCG8_9RHOB|nr:type II secretion system protein GspL [Sulfitobacter alexandrii]APE42010.1 hypothetical protein BOO69_00230 [Sulfitobacter alexandrii]